MYICSCYAVTDSQIKEAVKTGTKSFKVLCKKLKCCTNCGICAKSAKEVFDQALESKDKEDNKE